MTQSRHANEFSAQDFIKHLSILSHVATSAHIHFLSEGFERYIIKKPNPILKNHDRIVLYINTDHADITDAAKSTIIELTDHQGIKKFFIFNKGIWKVEACRQFFIDNQAIIDLTNMRRGDKPKDPELWNNLKIYKQEVSISTSYTLIYQQLSATIASFIQTKAQPIEILFIGCGLGNEMKGIMRYLESHHIKFVIYGIDRDQKNIFSAAANKEFQNKNVYFTCGDANDIDQHIEKFRSSILSKEIKPQTTITIASGFLTREVITPQESFHIFKTISSFSDNIFITGISENLITRRDAKSCGMSIEQKVFSIPFFTSIKKFKTIDHYLFNLQNKIEQIQNTLELQKNQSHKSINLKNYARPIEIIRYLIEKNWQLFQENKIEIHLQNAYLDMRGIKYILDFISQYKENITINLAGNEKWYRDLQALIIKNGFSTNIKVKPILDVFQLSSNHQTSGERAFSRKFCRKILMTYILEDDINSLVKLFSDLNSLHWQNDVIPLTIQYEKFILLAVLANHIKNIDWNVENNKGETLAYLFICKAIEVKKSPATNEEAELRLSQINTVLKILAASNVNLDKMISFAEDDALVLEMIGQIRNFNKTSTITLRQ